MSKIRLLEETRKIFIKEDEYDEGREVLLHRIEAVEDLECQCIRKGTIGGYVESLENIQDEGWVARNACVCGEAIVKEMATVSGNACVFGQAVIEGCAKVCGNAKVHGIANVGGRATIWENADIQGEVYLYGSAVVEGNAIIEPYFGKDLYINKGTFSTNALVRSKKDYVFFENGEIQWTFYKGKNGIEMYDDATWYKGTLEGFLMEMEDMGNKRKKLAKKMVKMVKDLLEN